MERPFAIYLDKPIVVDGISINHTKAGLEYLIEHYEHIHANDHSQTSDKDRQFRAERIKDFRLHLHLYQSVDPEIIKIQQIPA